MEAYTFNTIELILLSATGILLIIQLVYYFGLYNRIHTHNLAVKREEVHFGQELPALSVIISARNELENLRRNLPAILKQDYPNFEVIVINDGSTDESEDFLSELEEVYPNLYHSFTPNNVQYVSRKKLALTLGIKASKYDWLVFTEANCTPVSDKWLRRIARNFTSSTDIVLGYYNYEQRKGWLHKRASFDSLFTSLRYLGFALAGKPYMGIGRNLAYRKESFFKVKGFSTHLNMQRGEDDLFINQIANRSNTRVETSPDSVIRVQPVECYKDWKEEKVSYMATARFYKGTQRWLLGLETTTTLLFYITCLLEIVLGILSSHWLTTGLALLLWIVRYLTQAYIINKTASEMGDNDSYYLTLPVFDMIRPLQSLKFKLYRLYRKKGDLMRR